MFGFRTLKASLGTAALIACTLTPALHANAAEDEEGYLIVKEGQKVILQPLAMIFNEKADLKAYQDFYQGHFTHQEAEAYNAQIQLAGQALELKQAATATVLSQDEAAHEVQVQIEGTDPEWVDGCKLDPYSLQRMQDYSDWKELIEPGS
jgi:VCBS repeat-containing protein